MTIAIVALTLVVVLTAALIAADFLTETRRLDRLVTADRPTLNEADLMRDPREWVAEAEREVARQVADASARWYSHPAYMGGKPAEWLQKLHDEGWHPEKLSPYQSDHQWLDNRIDQECTQTRPRLTLPPLPTYAQGGACFAYDRRAFDPPCTCPTCRKDH